MVNSAQRNIAKTQAKISGEIVHLRLKALARHHVFEISKNETVKAIKDAAGKAIIDSYNLDIRDNLNAWQAWRELYYTFYPHLQEVVNNGS